MGAAHNTINGSAPFFFFMSLAGTVVLNAEPRRPHSSSRTWRGEGGRGRYLRGWQLLLLLLHVLLLLELVQLFLLLGLLLELGLGLRRPWRIKGGS